TPFVRGLEDPPLNPERLLFLDAETTGLGRGAGTYAFLIGLGSFVGGEFCIRQYFMPDYDSESALLELVAEELAAHDGLASFNGWTFDWPILQTRFLLARRPLPCSGEPHLDLLPLSRRLWRRMLPSCALASLEAGVLAVEREEQDVPSYLIPALYQDYVRLGRTRPIARIFYHNLLDLLSMVTLTARAGALLANPQAERARPFCDDLALGRMYESLGHHEEAIAAYRRAGQEAHRSLSFLLKRLGRYEEAMDIWRAQLGGREIYPYVELAKQYEHRLHDLEKARDMVIQALQRLEAHTAGDDARARRRELEHRLARLTRRLEMD
ncbi:MAG: ribonuclease H-like domain-containing protein, partial [Chloroflexi bacterium]|nr:ribonuclease H-like domain-containing protein [Chloroflexota bacterium]